LSEKIIAVSFYPGIKFEEIKKHWSLVIGNWSLVIGHWSLVNGNNPAGLVPISPERTQIISRFIIVIGDLNLISSLI
jgi:hypothetical protein